MKITRTLTLAVGFVGGLLIGATSQAIRLGIIEKQAAEPVDDTVPKFLQPDPVDDTPPTGSTDGGA